MDEEEKIEIKLLLEAVYLKYGYDFRNYAMAYVTRRVKHLIFISEFKSITTYIEKILRDPRIFEAFLLDLSINTTEMFRDPLFYKAVRENVIPRLKTYPLLKIWHAGCASGEEVYSMAILLKEEGLYKRSQIYATDFNRAILDKAKEGVFSIESMRDHSRNYQKSGGEHSFSDYYHSKYDYAVIDPDLKKNIVFAEHNLVSDGAFGEMNLILCRNVLIYFNRVFQDRAFKLFLDSLCYQGYLCLGTKETIDFSKWSEEFEVIEKVQRIYRKNTKS